MFSPEASRTKMAAVVITLRAYGVAVTNGARSAMARATQPIILLSKRRESRDVGRPILSGAIVVSTFSLMLHTLRYTLAENTGRPQCEEKDQHCEGEDVTPLATEPFRAERLDEPQYEATQHRAFDVADTTDDGSGEGLQTDDETHQEVDLAVVGARHHAGGASQSGADEEGLGDHRVDIDAHQQRASHVQGDRPHRTPGGGLLNVGVQRDHERGSDQHEDDLGQGHPSPEHVEHAAFQSHRKRAW